MKNSGFAHSHIQFTDRPCGKLITQYIITSVGLYQASPVILGCVVALC
jgi:hypothetical protein